MFLKKYSKGIRSSELLFAVLSLSILISDVQCQSQSQKLSNEIAGSESAAGPSAISPSPPHPAPVHIVSTNGHYRDYGQAFYYPNQKHIVWNRDSYADAASDFGYNQQHVHQDSHGSSQSFVPTSEYGAGAAEGHEGGEGGAGGLGGLGGLGGIAGILGIKGIKGLGLLGLLKAGLPLFALLLPALLLLPLVFLFLPVPVITIPTNPNNPGGGRRIGYGFGFGDMSAKVTQLARSVLDSEKCVERMSCELSRVNRGTMLDKTLKRVINKFETHLPKPLLRMARAYMDQSSYCNKKYACYLTNCDKDCITMPRPLRTLQTESDMGDVSEEHDK